MHFMTGVRKNKPRANARDAAKPHDPEWAAGLKRLYDSVVEEPIPDRAVSRPAWIGGAVCSF